MWASYWYGRYVIVADNARGIDILKMGRGAAAARREVVAPRMSRAQQSFLRRVERESFAPDPTLGWVCPLPRT